jgi:hypothetical protein
MKIICAWCKQKIGDKPGQSVSHGICDECYKNFMEELDDKNTVDRPNRQSAQA